MCGLFGFSDPSRCLSPEQARLLTRALAESSMVRGTDATGIAYNARHWLHIFKRAEPASCVPLFPPAGVHAIMGHVRLTTQGNARSNHNNHPFPGMLDGHRETKGPDFALAHNGVLQNDRDLRLRLHLPETTIETDSYVAVQMLEALGTLDLPTLQEVAEQLEGTFTLTLLDRRDTLYFVRGNNPLYLVEFPHLGLFVYASTAEILRDAVSRLDFLRTRLYSPIWLEEGEILSLSADGRMEMQPFRVSPLQYGFSMWDWSYWSASPFKGKMQADLLNTALNMGYEEEDVEILMACGYCDDEIEELLQDPELFRAALRESYYEYAFHGGGALP